ncbi:YggS family pyridoxal phosphate-dependent enzyme [Heyndrickxia acidicola]|uniref:Pyridoxal phosphate homeostasis protein n=1 Tax=Heyndrickxia acidicola TaxID=209389 RepID=A0ABU6MEN6_9BACI|nr:YggS family pyridoxal phosphate-dependent enzyme [Heyndrickxia acidicola]MED1202153.1 YggS family pyridoxal phosphate-dependent enzyme [Heyndrickxia acidicola]
MKVLDNLADIEEKIRIACEASGRDTKDVTIIAVTKYVTTERALEAVEAGVLNLGENRDDGLLEKWKILKDRPIWHFIGSLQTKKVKNIIDKVAYIHSLDRISLAQEIDKRASEPVNCFVQVNVSGEETKHGVKPDQVLKFIKELQKFEKIRVIGLMTMAPLTDDQTVIRKCFKELKKLQNDIQSLQLPASPCTELSMGMSNDYTIAIEEGATFIRIGTALVG